MGVASILKGPGSTKGEETLGGTGKSTYTQSYNIPPINKQRAIVTYYYHNSLSCQHRS